MKIFTVGHSSRVIEEFIQIIQSYGVEILIDIRRFPSSKKHPHFNKANLEQSLKKHNIIYAFLGDELGGFRKGGYPAHVQTEIFAHGIKKLMNITRRNTSCIMCAESTYQGCHRRFVADQLCKMGWQVIHIIDQNKTIPHPVSLV